MIDFNVVLVTKVTVPAIRCFERRGSTLGKRFDCAYIWCRLMQMRTTLNIDDQILEKASRLTGIKEKTQLLHEGLKTLIEKESARRLAKLAGSSPKISEIPRR